LDSDAAAQSGQMVAYQTGDYFKNHSWLGLDDSVRLNESTELREGRTGTALGYDTEPRNTGIFIIATVASFGYIYSDINNFYYNALEDLNEFKILADDAWTKMLSSNNQHTRFPRQVHFNSDAVVSSSIPVTGYRVYNCEEIPDNCPPGPPGPQGIHGEPGDDGEIGQPGRNGNSDTSCSYLGYDTSRCILCLVGNRGPTGLDGPEGPAGVPGMDGTPGQSGQHGALGEPGCSGEAGENGEPGAVGKPGANGRNGQRGKGNPGPPGEPGLEGPPGNPGDNGDDGIPGADGEIGLKGYMGNFGRDAHDRDNRVRYEVALGQGLTYCPCPQRTSAGATGGFNLRHSNEPLLSYGTI
uniref:Col_cuticle_N domain-containing protein n=1 Tax=Angiostrongylus cantonensis TaxID=6313 RepID=A0A0K0D421_ANGCA